MRVRSIAVSIFYWFVGASIAELASSMPTAAGGTDSLETTIHAGTNRSKQYTTGHP